jgi:chorismate--pyruvate lyase
MMRQSTRSERGAKQAVDACWLRAPLGAEGAARDWLLDRGSLTARLKSVCRRFSVRVIAQGRVHGGADEALLFGDGRTPLIGRDVLLMDGEVALVYAHSLLRADDLRGPWRAISRMGNRPLGAALFADPRIERRPLHFRRLHGGHPLYCAAMAATRAELPPLWARRSAFCLQGAPLLVTEAFLPGLADYWQSNRSR